ncbi:MAG: RNA polymerase sigma factor [Planctomycetota bacterium]
MPVQLDKGLVESAISGDLESFGKLCERYYSPMLAIAYSVLADHHLAEDAVQDTFARALISLRTLRKPDKFSPWLARICRNVANDIARKKTKYSNSELWQLLDNHSENTVAPAIRRAIGNLPAPARELIVMRYYDNLSYEQISAVLGISNASINSRLHRAKKKLLKALKRDGLLEDIP